MRILSFFRKSLKENLRDLMILILTLVMAPIYVLITYAVFNNTSQTYHVIIDNQDRGAVFKDDARINAGEGVMAAAKDFRYSDNSRVFRITGTGDLKKGQQLLRDRTADLVMVIPGDFSSSLVEQNSAKKASVEIYGDEGNPKYMMARVMIDAAIYDYVIKLTGSEFPLDIVSKPIENSAAPTPFGSYIPGLLALSLVSLMFTAVASIIKEVDKGTINRIKISHLRPMEFLTANSMTQAIIAVPVLLFAYVTAFCLGYRPVGSLLSVLIVGVISSFSIMGISLIVASFLKTIFELMTVGTLPYFILLFFSGAWFPMPVKTLFTIAGHNVSITDILPISHTVSAMSKILNYGAGLGDVMYELCAILILTVFYFSIGVRLFKRKHMRIA